MKIEDVTDGKIRIGSTTYTMVEAKYNGAVVWPLNVEETYQISSVRVVYSSGSMIYANGSNHVNIYGNVAVYRNGQLDRTINNAPLKLVLPVSSVFDYDSENQWYYGQNLTTNPSSEVSEYLDAYYGSYSASSHPRVTLTQQANVETPVGQPSYGPKTNIQTQDSGSPYNYTVSISTNKYTQSNPCPASGSGSSDYATLATDASCWQGTITTWTWTKTQNYSYTSGSSASKTTTEQGSEAGTPYQKPGTATITKYSGSNAFTLSGSRVSVASAGTTANNGLSATFRATFGSASSNVTLYQEANVRTVIGDPSYGSKTYGASEDPYTSISASSFTNQNQPCPAGGGSTALTYSAGYFKPWTRTVTETVKYTATGDQTYGETYTQSSSDAGQSRDEFTATPTISVSYPSGDAGGWAHRSGTTLEIDSRSVVTGNARSVACVASYSGQSSSVTLYQQYNRIEETLTDYDIQVAFDTAGNVPASGGTYQVNYTSLIGAKNTYTSGDQDAGYNYNPVTSTVAVTPNTVTTATTQVSGTGSFDVNFPVNYGAAVTARVTLTPPAAAGDPVWVERHQNPGSGIYATLKPFVSPLNGRVSLTLEIIGAGEPYTWPITFSNVKFNVTPNGGTTTTTTVTESLMFPDPVTGETSTLMLASRYGIPRPASGTESGVIVVQDKAQNPSMTYVTNNGLTLTEVTMNSANYTVGS